MEQEHVQNKELKILVTAFDPFGGEVENSSQMVLQSLPEEMGGARLCKELLPTQFERAQERITELIAGEQPDAVVMLGQAGGRREVSVERVAINLCDSTRADNAGVCPSEEPVAAEGPAAYFATLPLKEIFAALREAEIDAAISNTAGTFVCNATMYRALHLLDGTGVPAGFIHVPRSSSQEVEGMDPEQIRRAVEIVLATVAGFSAGRHSH